MVPTDEVANDAEEMMAHTKSGTIGSRPERGTIIDLAFPSTGSEFTLRLVTTILMSKA